jgi:hypothetical protein
MKIMKVIIACVDFSLRFATTITIYCVGFYLLQEVLGDRIPKDWSDLNLNDWTTILICVGMMNLCYEVSMKLTRELKIRDTNEY